MPGTDGTALGLLRQRCALVPGALDALLRAPPTWPALPPGLTLTTGIGGSEGPARLLAALLMRQGLAARFVPLSSFLHAPPQATSLVVFSQKLAPNALLALAHAHRYARALLVTGLTEQHPPLRPFLDRGLSLVTLPSGDERGLLVRVLGPAVASLAAVLLAQSFSPACREPLDNPPPAPPPPPTPPSLAGPLARALDHARALPPLPPGPLALLAAGDLLEGYEGLRWRLLEGMLHPQIALWDALAVAHGPFQSFHTESTTLLALESPDALPPRLTDRLCAMLRPGLHTLHRLPATLPAPWSLFEHTVQLDALMCASLEAHPRPLAPWPGQGEDGPLYLLDRWG